MQSRLPAVLFFLPICLGAQMLTFGVVAGRSLTDGINRTSYVSTGASIPDGETVSTFISVVPGANRAIIGPKLALRLPWRFSIEAEALHRTLTSRETYAVSFSGATPGFMGRFNQTLTSWEFPVVGRYHFSRLPLSPFVEAGTSLRPAGSNIVSHWGASGGMGVELQSHGFRIAPEIRYTHWKADETAMQDQVELLVGIDRPGASHSFASAFGKSFSLGLLAGVGLGDDLKTGIGQRPYRNTLVAGAVLEVSLYRGLSLETDGIYRPLHATDLPSALGAGDHFAVLTWEFPLMGKYKFRRERTLRPFAELGPAFRLDGNFNGPTPSHYGMVVGGGIETRIWRLRISPTVRYARWGPPRTPQGGGTFRNEIETLVGVAF